MLWKKILIAFDNSEHALRAVEYVGQVFAHCPEMEVALVGLHEKVPEHDIPQERSPFYKEVHSRLASLETNREQGRGFINNTRQHLIKMGFDPDKVEVIYEPRKQSLAKDLITLCRERGFGTIVLGGMNKTASSLAKELKGASIVCVV